MIDLDRATKGEREAYEAGLAEGQAKAAAAGPQWTKPTFYLAAGATMFSMWMAYYLLTHVETPDLALVQALIATVSAVPLIYMWPRKPTSGGGS